MSPPPATETSLPWRVRSAAWRAVATVPWSKGAISKAPSGPFQKTVRASLTASANARADSGPMSSPIWSSEMESAATVVAGASALNSGATRMSVGSRISTPLSVERAR